MRISPRGIVRVATGCLMLKLHKRNRRNKRHKVSSDGDAQGLLSWAQQRGRMLFSTGIALIGVGVLVWGVRLAWQQLLTSPRLQLLEVEIFGNTRIPKQTILEVSSLKRGEPIFAINLDDVRTNLLQIPWVSEVGIQRKLPNTVRIDLQEHNAQLIVNAGSLYLANSAGQLFKTYQAEDNLNLPIVTGLEKILENDQTYLHADPIRDALALVQTFASFEKTLGEQTLGRLEEIHWDNMFGFSIFCWPAFARPVRIDLGMTPEKSLPLAYSAFREAKRLHQQPSAIMANFKHDPERVHVQLKSSRANDKSELLAKAR